MANNANANRPSESTADPNPSVTTAEAIDRAVANAESRITARINGMEKAVDVFHADLTRVPTAVDKAILGLRELLETRLSCIEHDIVAVRAFLDTRGKDISEQIVHLHKLLTSDIENVNERTEKLASVSGERFARIETQFVERDKRTDQLSLADKTAVAAALQAAKEAVGAQNTSNSIAIAKSESSTIESIKQLQTLFNSSISNVKDALSIVNSRLDKWEGRSGGTSDIRTDNRANLGITISAAVAAVVIVSALVGAIAFFTKAPAPVYLPIPPLPQSGAR